MKPETSHSLFFHFRDGKQIEAEYSSVKMDHHIKTATALLENEDGYRLTVTDCCEPLSDSSVRFTRIINGKCLEQPKCPGQGVRISSRIQISEAGESNGLWRFCIPSIRYTRPERIASDSSASGSERGSSAPDRSATDNIMEDRLITCMEDRLTANLAVAWRDDTQEACSIMKITPARSTSRPERTGGEQHFLQKTECCSLGYRTTSGGDISFCISWPYAEESESVALDSSGSPLYAYYPLDGGDFQIAFSYLIDRYTADSYTDSVYQAYRKLAGITEQMDDQKTVRLPFGTEESIGYRLSSLERTYREFSENGAGFFFHFDPRKGYGSLPSGFGTSFHTIPHDSYPHILEYGFTGRQINTALVMAAARGGCWTGRGIRVIDFFLDHCMTPNGWLYSLYDLNTKAPFFSFGDPDAPKLHYISVSEDKGNYLRTMTEPMNDVLEAYQWYRSAGIKKKSWLDCVLLFAGFLAAHQQADGSWSRAYRPDGTPARILNSKGGADSATAIPLIFLCNLCRELQESGMDDTPYLQAARKAGRYTLDNFVKAEHYEGGTLDNPNVVDKEAAQYAMAGLLHLYRLTGDEACLQGAKDAAKIFVTWNYIWNAPVAPGTYLAGKNFKTRGYGAINSIWGGGVVDIYSLFHIRELYELGALTGETYFCRMAEQIAQGTCQILSWPQDFMGFADIGMQPEGFGICPQGEDEGMIRKGDIWGTLGWIYSAGIYGLGRFLSVQAQEEHCQIR